MAKEKVCDYCGEKPNPPSRLWPYGYGQWICTECSIVRSIEEDSGDMYEYDINNIVSDNYDF